jgi:hypothetical protein
MGTGNGLDNAPFALNALPALLEALRLRATQPALPSDVLPLLVQWHEAQTTLQRACDAAAEVARLQPLVEAAFVQAAVDADWADTRAVLAESAGAWCRFFSSRWRTANGRLRGLVRAKEMTAYPRCVEALDELMALQAAHAKLASLAPDGAPLLGSWWGALCGPAADPARVAPLLRTALAWEQAATGNTHRAVLLDAQRLAEAATAGRAAQAAATADALASAMKAVNAAEQPVFAMAQFGSDAPAFASLPLPQYAALAEGWAARPGAFNDWPAVRSGLALLQALGDKDLRERVDDGRIAATALPAIFELAVFESLWRSLVAADPALAGQDGAQLDRLVAEFRRLDAKRAEVAATEVSALHYLQRPTGQIGDMAVLRGELNKSRRLLPTRKLLEKAGHAIQRLKPVFLMSPLSVAQYLAPGQLMFDLLVIDEASQVKPADALGAVARARQVVVVGKHTKGNGAGVRARSKRASAGGTTAGGGRGGSRACQAKVGSNLAPVRSAHSSLPCMHY